MTAIRKPIAWSLLAFLTFTSAAFALVPRQQPAPPIAEPKSVILIKGDLVLLALKLPTKYQSGDAIPDGTPVKIHVCRSRDGGKTYTVPVRIITGGSGKIGQRFDGVWVEVPVGEAAVFLAACAEVHEVTSPLTTRHLTFVAEPKLTCYATPGEAPGAAVPTPAQPDMPK